MGDPQQETDFIVSELADDEDMVELVELFIGELPQRVAAVERALERRDYETLATLAHQLKGEGGGYGFPAITSAAKQLEDSSKTGQDIEKLTQEVKQIVDLCSRTRAKR